MFQRSAAAFGSIRSLPFFAICFVSTFSKVRRRSLQSFATGAAAAIFFASLVLTPVASYAAQAQSDSAPANPQIARVELSTTVAGNHLKNRHDESADPARPLDSVEYGAAMVRLPGHVLPALARATLIAPADGHAKAAEAKRPLTLTISLKRDDQPGFERALHEIYDPSSENFHHFLTQREISRRFGPSRQSYKAALAYLRAHGFHLVQGSANHLTITVRGSRAQAERAFNLRIRDYRIDGEDFYANDDNPALPRKLATRVGSVSGLSDYMTPARLKTQRDLTYACGAGAASIAIIGVFTPLLGAFLILALLVECALIDYACWDDKNNKKKCVDPNAYNWNNMMKGLFGSASKLPKTSTASAQSTIANRIDGTGQSIGLVEFDSFQNGDVADYLNLLNSGGISTAPIGNLSELPVNGGATPGANQDEVLLDVDTVMTIAPGAKVTVYDAPFTGAGSFQTLFNKMIDDGVSIISNSWAYCEDQTSASDVDSIDSILQNAAAAGISVFNGSGDHGSTCLDGSPNVVSVPADSPNATAVGGSSLTAANGFVYGSETWWNNSTTPPPDGQGGFGVSKFFSRPAFQDSFTASPGRSVPDIVINADPAKGVIICQAANGGCPSPFLYGGTSVAAPIWAASAALLNQSQGKNIGNFNTAIYPFANTKAFHNAASMGSDFAHVGLGSPNVDALHVALTGSTDVTPDPAQSLVYSTGDIVGGVQLPLLPGAPADGSTPAVIVVQLTNANLDGVSGKTVTLTANSGSSAKVTPASGVSSVDNAAVVFKVTDQVVETVTLTAKDTSDGIVLEQTVTLPFVTPTATTAGLDAFPASVSADGKTNAVITVRLKDSLGRPSPGKLVSISQGSGHSLIKGPIPSVTDASGQVQFTAVDQVAESVTYSAVDITDGNVPFPTTGTVAFTGGPANGCGNSAPPAAPGFLVTPYATGFITQNYSFGDIDFTCGGVYGMAFDTAGNLYVSYGPTGDIYKFKPGGGVADATTLLTTTALGPSAARVGLRQERQPVRQPRCDHRELHYRSCLPDRSFQRYDPAYGCVRSDLPDRAFGRPAERGFVYRRFLLDGRIG